MSYCELCDIGYAATREIAEPDVKESALSAIVENSIHDVEIGYKGLRQVQSVVPPWEQALKHHTALGTENR